MSMKNKTAVIFGGTGFVGRQIVRELAKKGVTIKVATRVPERAYFLKPCGAVGQVVPFACDYSEAAIQSAVKGCDYVVNCIGILYQRGRKNKFQRIHTSIPEIIAKAAKHEKIESLIHISALGIEDSKAKYAKSKLDGEEEIRKGFKKVTILRPSVIFGEDDNFFNMFAHLARFTPILPLIGGGKTKFQPVFVGDVADAAIAALTSKDAKGKIYELGGAETIDFKGIYDRLFTYTNRKRVLMPLPFCLAKIQAFFLSLLPNPILTPDQVESLKTDSIVSEGALTLSDLGITPTAMDLILPRYLEIYRQGGRFEKSKYA